jgi:hypothetical protein
MPTSFIRTPVIYSKDRDLVRQFRRPVLWDPDADPDLTYRPDAGPISDFYLMRIWSRIRIFLFDADAYPDPDPAFHLDTDRDPDPSFQIKAQTLENVLK